MKNKGCWTLFFAVAGGLAAIYWVFRGIYALFLPPTAAPLSMFHEHIVSFHSYYTAVPGGTLMARILVTSMFTFALWLLLWIVTIAVSKLSKSKRLEDALGSGLFYVLAILLLYSLVASVFIPKRLVVFDTTTHIIEVTEYEDFFYIWPNPVPKSRFQLGFEEIREFRFSIYENLTMGASHLESDLFAFTESDTILVGSTMLYHGEFGWITDWRPYAAIEESGKRDANKVAHFLEDLMHHRH